MSLLDNIKKQINKALDKKPSVSKMSFGYSYSTADTPKIIEYRNKDWVYFGEDNLYPVHLKELTKGSPIHGAIIKTKALMIAGDGFLINGAEDKEQSEQNLKSLDSSTKAEYLSFIKNELDPDDLIKIKEKISYDLAYMGAYSLEIIWNGDFTKIARIKYLNVSNIRAGKYKKGKIENYFYSRDWSKCTKEEYKPYPLYPFDRNDKQHVNQIYFEKLGDLEYYGEPTYIDALTWIQTDVEMGFFHLSNIQNGLNPSMLIKFYEKPESDEQQQEILNKITNKYVGAKKTGKHMVFFSNGKELSPDVQPIPVANLDKQYLALSELCDRKIVTGHQLTSPLLAGISTSGQLGANQELEIAYQIFDNVIISPLRNLTDKAFNKFINVNTKITIATNKFMPFDPESIKSYAPNIVEQPKPEENG